jgi:N-ethylmaleimide reductase
VPEAVAAGIGAERVGPRVFPGNTVNGIAEGETEELYPALAERLGGLGLAYPHLGYADPRTPVYGTVRAAWPGVIVANPVLREVSTDGVLRASTELLAAGADLIALGRPFLANPDLVERLRLGAPLDPVRDRYFMYVGGATGCTDYPALGAQETGASSDSIVALDGGRVC